MASAVLWSGPLVVSSVHFAGVLPLVSIALAEEKPQGDIRTGRQENHSGSEDQSSRQDRVPVPRTTIAIRHFRSSEEFRVDPIIRLHALRPDQPAVGAGGRNWLSSFAFVGRRCDE